MGGDEGEAGRYVGYEGAGAGGWVGGLDCSFDFFGVWFWVGGLRGGV